MIPAQQIQPANAEERYAHEFDLRDIDAANPNSFWRLQYLERIEAEIGLVDRYAGPAGAVLDVGCAQGNLAILLSERGYRVTAVDSRKDTVSYGKKKEDRSAVRWIVGDAFEFAKKERFRAVVMGELIEHVTDPVGLLRKGLQLVESDGVLVLTTPNGHCVTNRLPSFMDVRRSTSNFAGIRIGPSGEDHIFAFRLAELIEIARAAGGEIVEWRWMGSSGLNSHVQWLLNFPGLGTAYHLVLRALSRISILGRFVAPNLVLVARHARP